MAFPLTHYLELLGRLRESGYSLGPVRSYFEGYSEPAVFLRHDVDRLPSRALRMARGEGALGIISTYYFRSNSHALFPEAAVRAVSGLGHEVGYHYEVVTRHGAHATEAVESFKRDLEALRRLAEVKTVAAHGSPLSRLSNIAYANTLDLASLDILGEPQTDFDFSRVVYITDSGGIFGSRHNRRDWSTGKNLRIPMSPRQLGQWLNPEREPLVLLNTHPERWPDGAVAARFHGILDAGVNVLKLFRK